MTITRSTTVFLILVAALLLLPATAFAEDGKGPDAGGMLAVLLGVVLVLIACVGMGATALLLRVMLPGVAAAADASIARVGTKRLMLVGVVPLVGAFLIAGGVGAIGNQVLGAIYFLVVGLPLALCTLVGAMAAVPRVGSGALRSGSDPSPLARCAVGGLVLGLAMVSWGFPPLGLLVSLLLTGWFLGTGLGVCLPRSVGAAPATEAADTPVG